MTYLTGSRNDGWTYEPADPSVGIPDGGWFHESCPALTEDDITMVRFGEVDTDARTITCPHCGEVTS